MRHDPDRGCEIKWARNERTKTRSGKKLKEKVKIYYCTIHQKEICRCGYEWGGHKTGIVINTKSFIDWIKNKNYKVTDQMRSEIRNEIHASKGFENFDLNKL